ncbi:hypothetical protein M5E82_17415 [Parabacteroides distasonis]|nr:hypothetical protein M5E82_17415 [Parabacteroides distasonis]
MKDLDGSGKTLVSYVDGNKYVYLATRSSDGKMILVKGSSTSLTGTSVLSIGLNQGNIPQELELGAKDLNTLLQSAVENSFRLNMTPEVTSGKKNHLTATDLVAEDATEGYVLLQAKDQKKMMRSCMLLLIPLIMAVRKQMVPCLLIRMMPMGLKTTMAL